MSPLWLLKYLPNMPASHLAIYNDFRGPNNSLTHARGGGQRGRRRGLSDHPPRQRRRDAGRRDRHRLHPMKTVHAVQQEEVWPTANRAAAASRPFDRDRRGMVLGEGARGHRARRAGARPGPRRHDLRRGAGAATSSVAGRQAGGPARPGDANVLQAVLARRPGHRADDVGHLHAHGLSTRTCDAEEARAIGEASSPRGRSRCR